jgi:hypothetical protein
MIESKNSIGVGAAIKVPVSEKLLDMANGLVEQSKNIGERVNNRLLPISRQEPPPDLPNKPVGCEEWPQWPPYFSHVRAALGAIENNLIAIDEAISRLEL